MVVNDGIFLPKRRIISMPFMSSCLELMALGFFTESGLEVYWSVGEDVLENIELFHQNQLLQSTNSTMKGSSACSGSCGSCNTTCKS